MSPFSSSVEWTAYPLRGGPSRQFDTLEEALSWARTEALRGKTMMVVRRVSA